MAGTHRQASHRPPGLSQACHYPVQCTNRHSQACRRHQGLHLWCYIKPYCMLKLILFFLFLIFSLGVFNQLVGSGDLCGVIHGRGEKASFIPAIYTNMQIHWLNSFLSSNGYLGTYVSL